MRRGWAAALVGLGALRGLGACDAALDQRLAIVDAPRVLAVIAEPAEAAPGSLVTYTGVLAGPDGPLADVPRWAFCTTPKSPAEDNAVADGCVRDPAAGALVDLGSGPSVTGALPADGCLRFGPDTPPGDYRPRAADETGGYYQPVRVDVDTAAGPLLAFGLSRITCQLPAAPPEVARDYDLRYVANSNPTLTVDLPARVAAHTDVTLGAAWPDAAVERYLAFDPARQVLVDRGEAMRVSWFVTGGALAVDATAVDEDGAARAVATTWSTPGAGPAWIWVVLRDSRGGVAIQAAPVTVE